MNAHTVNWFSAVDALGTTRPQRTATLLPELAPYWQLWSGPAAQAAMTPLRVTVEITGVMAGYHNLQFDNLLARLVVDRAFGGAQLDDSASPYLLPAPLRILWQHPVTGLPLYAANPLEPGSHNLPLTVWWHKRFVRPEHAAATKEARKANIQPNQGRFKEKRTPLPAQTASVWQVDCVGCADSIAELLRLCARLGKRRMATVEEWVISPLDDFRLARPAPLAYLGHTERLPLDTRYCGWSPPYWPGVPECQDWCCLPQ